VAGTESERRRNLGMMVDQIERNLGTELSVLAGITPNEAYSLTECGRLVEMSDKAKQMFMWWRDLHQLLNPPQAPVALELAAEPPPDPAANASSPSRRPPSSVDLVRAVLRDGNRHHIDDICRVAGLSRSAVTIALNALDKSNEVHIGAQGFYWLAMNGRAVA
jgi:hypothetical protein